MTQRSNRYDVRTAEDWLALHIPGRPGKIVRDAEVRAFIDRHISKMTFTQLAAMCRERFGHERAPTRSTIGRYWSWIRGSERKPAGKGTIPVVPRGNHGESAF